MSTYRGDGTPSSGEPFPTTQDLQDAVDAAEQSATDADASATAASTSEANAATSETNASTSETNAGTSETNAASSESAAATSETNAGTSETNAATSESNAATSETNAATSASEAAASAASMAQFVGFGDVDGSISAATVRFAEPLRSQASAQATTANFNNPAPNTGTLRNLRVNLLTNSFDASHTVGIDKNGTPTGIVVTFGAAVTGAQSDEANTLSVTAFDQLSLRIDASGTTSGFSDDYAWSFEIE